MQLWYVIICQPTKVLRLQHVISFAFFLTRIPRPPVMHICQKKLFMIKDSLRKDREGLALLIGDVSLQPYMYISARMKWL